MTRKRSLRISLSVFAGVFVLVFQACTPAASNTAKTAVAGIIETVQMMESRTPYPTIPAFPTQTAYPSLTAYPTEAGYDPRLDAVVGSLRETATTYPAHTPYPTEPPYSEADAIQTILMQPGLWSRDLSLYGRCGDLFEVRIGTHPAYFAYAVGNEVSRNQFLVVSVGFLNISDRTIPEIFHKQFFVAGDLDGEEVRYTSYGPAGQAASDRWGKHYIGGISVPPGIEVYSFLAFDVDYHAENWRLGFESDAGSGFGCNFSIPVQPQPEFSINFYATAEHTP